MELMDIDVLSFSKYKDLKFPKNGICRRFFLCLSYFLHKKLIASHSLPISSLPYSQVLEI